MKIPAIKSGHSLRVFRHALRVKGIDCQNFFTALRSCLLNLEIIDTWSVSSGRFIGINLKNIENIELNCNIGSFWLFAENILRASGKNGKFWGLVPSNGSPERPKKGVEPWYLILPIKINDLDSSKMKFWFLSFIEKWKRTLIFQTRRKIYALSHWK